MTAPTPERPAGTAAAGLGWPLTVDPRPAAGSAAGLGWPSDEPASSQPHQHREQERP